MRPSLVQGSLVAALALLMLAPLDKAAAQFEGAGGREEVRAMMLAR